MWAMGDGCERVGARYGALPGQPRGLDLLGAARRRRPGAARRRACRGRRGGVRLRVCARTQWCSRARERLRSAPREGLERERGGAAVVGQRVVRGERAAGHAGAQREGKGRRGSGAALI